MIDQKKLENVEYFGSVITNIQDVHMELNAGLPWPKQY
jgi:hypothetical protein